MVPMNLSALTFYSCVPPVLADSLGIKVRNLGTPAGLAAMMLLIRKVLHNLQEHHCKPVPRRLPSLSLWALLVLLMGCPRCPSPPAPHPRL